MNNTLRASFLSTTSEITRTAAGQNLLRVYRDLIKAERKSNRLKSKTELRTRFEVARSGQPS